MGSLKDLLPIKTSRLRLRIPEPNEAHLMVAYVNANKEHLRPWEPHRSEGFYTLQFWEAEMKKIQSEFFQGESLRLCIFLKGSPTGPIIGVCNFSNFLKGVFQACFLGYSMDHRYQGQGIMYEALYAAIPFVFKNLRIHRVMANYMPRNERSGRLLRKLGFMVEGYGRDYLKIAGQWEDHILTSIISDEPGDRVSKRIF